MQLRTDVVFHDGTAVSAPLIAELLRKAIDQASNLLLYPSLSAIESITPRGRSALEVRVSRPAAFLLEDLSLAMTHGPGQAGTGPFQIVSRGEDRLVLDRFDRYYLGKPSIAKVVVVPFEGLRSAWATMLRGGVDVVAEVQPDAVDFVRGSDVRLMAVNRAYQYLIAFNSSTPPFTSPHVRRALNLAISRKPLIERVLRGYGAPSTGVIWPQHWAYDPDAPAYAYDPDRAEAILDAAGFPRRSSTTATLPPARLRFTCLVARGFSIVERMALEVQKQLFAIGVDMQLDVVTPADLDTRIRSGDFDAVLTDLVSGPTLGRPYIFWRSAKTSKGLNVFGYENAEANRLFEQLSQSTSDAATRTATHRLQQVMLDDPPALFIAWSQKIRAVSRKFNVVAEPDRDPLFTLWRWTADNSDVNTRSAPAR